MYYPGYNSRMEKKDGRALPHAVREEIRKRAVSRVLNGESPEVVIESLGFHRSRIYDWLNQYRQRGEAGVTIPRQSRGLSICEPLKAAVGVATRPLSWRRLKAAVQRNNSI
jgi:DNA invertase Pin-like site-specific DNA recombinase